MTGIIFALALAAGLTGCGGGKEADVPATTEAVETTTEAEKTTAAAAETRRRPSDRNFRRRF